MRSRLLLPFALVYLLLLLSSLLLSPLSVPKFLDMALRVPNALDMALRVPMALDTALNSSLGAEALSQKDLPAGEPVLSSLASCENVTGPASLPDQLRWHVLRVALAILQVTPGVSCGVET